MTREVLLISTNKDFISLVKISALTLTKLNHQVTIETVEDESEALKRAQAQNLNLIIIDLAGISFNGKDLIKSIRINENSSRKKILALYTGDISAEERQALFESGCDSVMGMDEFKRVVNNILEF